MTTPVAAAFIYSPELAGHVLREDHPLRPHRLRLAYDLLAAYGVFEQPGALLAVPRPATTEELLPVHSAEYIEAVRLLNRGDEHVNAARYNFNALGDNPPYPGMFEAALLSTGASLLAADLVMSGDVRIAFNASGGLHHAMRDRASGFCVFNDPAVAIAHLVARGQRVAYVDVDAHHGDGVQAAFYGSDQVLTISIHESGCYLFPGSGEVRESGESAGRGHSVNLPLLPYTDDDTYMWAFEATVPPLLEAFAPQVLVLQLGVDAHYLDPLAHLQLTTRAYSVILPRLLGLASKVVALGGGGYDIAAVARVWALEYGWMLGIDLPDEIPEAYQDTYGVKALRDPQPPQFDPSVIDRNLTYAEAQVTAIKATVFPFHGL